MKIRHPTAADLADISLLFEQLGFSTPVEQLVARLEGMQHQTLIAALHSRVVGSVTTNIMPVLHRPTPVGRISALIVSERERGNGVGKALVEAAENMLREQGCGLVEVTCNYNRENAHAYYKHLGYEATSIRFLRVW